MKLDQEREIGSLLRENTEMVRENNRLLKKIRRNAAIELWLRILWIALLIGLPFILYFYVLEPYFALFGSSYEQFRLGIGEIPGLKGFDVFFPQE